MVEVGERIKFLRTQKNMSVNKLANRAGVSQSYVRDIELQRKKPSVEILSYLCEALDISMHDFFDEDNVQNLMDDPLIMEIYKLNPKQRQALYTFIDSFLKK